ncbi:Cof-type HAD-IIB family hydrolase [Radiobacillus kanasensis]|uniref:Cof-type HAD-IIB family hydrolase n=1 Tax=Radiobacillus kanasensis TaxID=2844358 RepID=UPI001E3E1E85|nr:Cof-type HAD-IIB family hydrolase [Radiobacillus kanasensis]UFU00881.1 Cof-type HAD-IIB family hydrolase [Radiobacillus kanasensis]
MKHKIVFFDIDGTLVNHNKEIPVETIEAVKQLKQNGVYVAIATGRAPFMFEDIREMLGIDSYVSFNGQFVVFEGEVVYKNPLTPSRVEELSEMVNERGQSIVYMNHVEMKATKHDDKFTEEALHSLKFSYPEVDPDFYKKTEIYQSLLFCEKEEEYQNLYKDLRFVRWHEYSCDVLPEGGSKAVGVEKLIEASGLRIEDSFAFGDGLNDMEMIQHVGTGVAMGNAIPALKEVADYVTEDVDNAGLYKGLVHFGLLKEEKSGQ